MNRTTIEWVKNPDGSQGYTWNPITGCLNHNDGKCKDGNFPCYAYRLANGRLKQRYLTNTNIPLGEFAFPNAPVYRDPFFPRFWPERLERLGYCEARIPDKYQPKRRGIFCCDMSDLFGIGVPEDWTRQALKTIKGCYRDRFYLLTKQPQNLARFSPYTPNCWVGATITTFDQAVKTIYAFKKIVAKVKYVSMEPLLEEIAGPDWHGWPELMSLTDWVIIGAQTKPYKPPKIEWVQAIVEYADKAGVPVFLKDNLEKLINTPKNKWAFQIYRQEMPE